MPKNLLRPIVEIVVASFAIADGRLSVAVVRRDAWFGAIGPADPEIGRAHV